MYTSSLLLKANVGHYVGHCTHPGRAGDMTAGVKFQYERYRKVVIKEPRL